MLLLVPAADAAGGCPNEAIREAQGTTDLPECMALEMVSPAKKFVEPASAPVFSADGERVRFRSLAALAETPGLQSYSGDQYIATRTAGGWDTAPTSPPSAAEIWIGGEYYGGPFAYSADLSRWNLMGATQVQFNAGVFRIFSSGLDGSFFPLSPLFVPIDDSGTDELVRALSSTESSGTSTDLSTTVFSPALVTTSFLPDDPQIEIVDRLDQDFNNYVVSLDSSGEPSIELLARDKDGKVWGEACGAHIGGGTSNGGGDSFGKTSQGAISADGARILISTRPAQSGSGKCGNGVPASVPLRILKRTRTPSGPVIEPLLHGGQAEWEEAGDDLFEGASVDGSKVYFTTTRALLPSDQDSGSQCSAEAGASTGCDLYLYDFDKPVGQRLTQVSLPTQPGESADVLHTITAISGDGSHAYFVAEGILSGANAAGDSPTQGKPNLYLYERDGAHPNGQTTFIATLDPGDEGRLWGVGKSFFGDSYAVPRQGKDGEGHEIGGDGHVLAFATKAPLSASDADGTRRDVYRYDSSSESLECVSCSSSGAEEGFDVSVVAPTVLGGAPTSAAAVEARWASEDGETVAFSTAEPLAAGDDDASANAYLWHQGELSRLPGTVGAAPTLSLDGKQIAYATRGALLSQDIDTASDIYIARVDGGFASQPETPVCGGEGCQGPRGAPSRATVPAFVGPGNPPKQAGCKKPKVKRRSRCVKPVSRHPKKRTSGKQGGKK
ncbi:MAG TPA: hypothetical protein VG816_14065 [Solirubrobacterales bacterium]|nr:hypothetical protein [Solirubrobacterales bacterium]